MLAVVICTDGATGEASSTVATPAAGTGGPDDEPSRATWARLRLLATERVAQLQAEDAIDVLQRVHETSIALSEPLTLADAGALATGLAVEATGLLVPAVLLAVTWTTIVEPTSGAASR